MKQKARIQATIRTMRQKSPLFSKLQDLATLAEEQFRSTLHGFDNIGLNVGNGVPNGRGSFRAPLNSKCFASTGGEGVQFGFLAEKNEVHFDQLPVVITIPMSLDSPWFILGENLYEFLSLGVVRGYFALEQLGHDLEKTLDVYGNSDWQATTREEFWVGFGAEEMQQAVLKFLSKELHLVPWADVKTRFKELQASYMPRLRLPESYEG